MGERKEMIKKLKYMLISIIDSVKHDLFKNWKDLDRPKEIMNILIVVFLIQLFLRRFTFIGLTVILYIAAYVWKVIRRGEWKNLMREGYKKL